MLQASDYFSEFFFFFGWGFFLRCSQNLLQIFLRLSESCIQDFEAANLCVVLVYFYR